MTNFASNRSEDAPGGSGLLAQRSVRVLLQGNVSLEGKMHIPEGQSLVGFLEMKKYFVNLTSVTWLDGRADTEAHPHVSIRISRIIWVVPLDNALSLSSAVTPTDQSRDVELDLVGGLQVQVTLNIADEQRMSDFFDSNSSFIPLRSARVQRSQEVLDRLAVHHAALLTIREI